MDEQVRTLLPHWGLESESTLRRDESVWEIGGRFMLKAYDDLPSLERNARVLTVLHENGIPTAQVISAVTGGSHVAHESRFYLLTTRLEEENRPPQETDFRRESNSYKLPELLEILLRVSKGA